MAEGLNNVDNEVERFYKLNCPTFHKKVTGLQENFKQGNHLPTVYEQFILTIKTGLHKS